MPKGIPLTDEEQARRKREIFEAAARVIFTQGFNETSMRRIAEAAGVGKSTLYDYFPTKEDILLFVFEEELDSLTRRAEGVIEMDMRPADKLRLLMQYQLDLLNSNKSYYLQLNVEIQRLSAASQKRVHEKRHTYQDILCNIIDQGIQQGIFRPVNRLLAARTLLALASNVVFTTRPSGTAREMMEDALSLFFDGINFQPMEA